MRIADYAIIGDCRSAALVSRSGSVDWLCWPRFDSPSLFGALLDQEKGGRFLIAPRDQARTSRRYVGNSNVLETTFETARGRLRLTDLMPVASEENKRRELRPQHEILRQVECMDGEVEVEVVYTPRPDYACIRPRLQDRGALGIHYDHRESALVLRSEIPLSMSREGAECRGTARLRRGERRSLSLCYGRQEPVVMPQLGDAATGRIRESCAWWEEWASRCTYQGPYRDAVIRSALALKLMTFAPSGAVVASPTTSLPEAIGGVRNWDYRYCWLRDASLTIQALFDLGYPTEAEAFLSWLLHSTKMTRPGLRPMYTIYGEHRIREKTLDHLAGFNGSRPVRIGNGAAQQLQLDVYGELLDAVYQFVRRGGHLDRMSRRLLRGLGKSVERLWDHPDKGIWEERSEPRHHTFSIAMCWVGLDRLIKLHDELGLPISPRTAAIRDQIADAVEREGFNPRIGSYTLAFGGDDVDASLLRLGRHGFIDPASPRARATLARIIDELGSNGLIYRYRADDGLPPGEGAFVICSFWAVTAQNAAGDREAAIRRFESLLVHANDVGLYAEEVDPDTGEHLGNFPQAFSHVGLIDAALALAEQPKGAAHTSAIGRERH